MTDPRFLSMHSDAELQRWGSLRVRIRAALADIGSPLAEYDHDPTPPSAHMTRSKNLQDLIRRAAQLYELHRRHDPVHGSKDRSNYRRALIDVYSLAMFYTEHPLDPERSTR